jgi:hypothetical protein
MQTRWSVGAIYIATVIGHVRAAGHRPTIPHDVTARNAPTSVMHVSCPVHCLYHIVTISAHDIDLKL